MCGGGDQVCGSCMEKGSVGEAVLMWGGKGMVWGKRRKVLREGQMVLWEDIVCMWGGRREPVWGGEKQFLRSDDVTSNAGLSGCGREANCQDVTYVLYTIRARLKA